LLMRTFIGNILILKI